ncbi:cytokine-dependent hematopoietic cell linker isoform X2 [Esox lucius]|nr:cytokine-dependent hematopoietic cell linker isoform X2 [Esox lucius]
MRKNMTKQEHGRYSNVDEDEYHVPDNHVEVFPVQIHPARSHQCDREYADRDLSRSSSTQSIHSGSSGSPVIPPRFQRGGLPCTPRHTGPPVNRQLKPGKQIRTQLDERMQAKESTEQNMQPTPSFRSLKPLANDLVKKSGLDLERPCRRDRQRRTQNVECNIPLEGQCLVRLPLNHNQRYSLDLESQLPTDIRLQEKDNSTAQSSVKRQQHHEWPQTKDDQDHIDFVPKERPCQMYNDEDWYIGPCDRVDAEHALHLVNKDGAFLVRDCSRNINSEPFVLVVFHDKRVFNVKIRFIPSKSKYALGTGQRANDMFDSVADIVKFHSIFPVVLIDGRNQSANRYQGNCVLTYPITKEDVNQLLA